MLYRLKKKKSIFEMLKGCRKQDWFTEFTNLIKIKVIITITPIFDQGHSRDMKCKFIL